jgi:hypothetical protein
MAKKAIYDKKYIGKGLGTVNSLYDRLIAMEDTPIVKLLGLGDKKLQKSKDKQTRVFNKTGLDDPFLLDLLKDMSRPARQGAVGLGLGAGKLSGLDTSDWLSAGNQAPGMVGDWSFALDEEERQALQENPGKEIGKSIANVGGTYLTGGLLSALGPAISQVPSAIGRIGLKGTTMLPGNLLQAYGQTEEYKGESPMGAMLGSAVASYGFPAIEEGLGALGRASQRVGSATEDFGEEFRRGSKGLQIPEEPGGPGKIAQAEKQAQDVIEKWTKKSRVGGRNINQAWTEIDSELNDVISNAQGQISVDEIAEDAAKRVAGPLGLDVDDAYNRFLGELNATLTDLNVLPENGMLSVEQLANLKRATQRSAFMAKTNPSLGIRKSNQAALHDTIYPKLKEFLGDKGASLYDDLDKLWKVAPEIMQNLNIGYGSTEYNRLLGRVPGFRRVISGLGEFGGAGMSAGGKALNAFGQMGEGISNIARQGSPLLGQVASQVGSRLGRGFDVDQESQQQAQQGQVQQVPGQGLGQTYDLSQVGLTADPNDPLGLFAQQQQVQPQQSFDMQKFQTDLLQAVLSGNISPSEAEFAMSTVQNMVGGPSLTDEISAIAQRDPKQAAALLGQGVLSGQIDPTAANSYAKLLGLTGDSQLSSAGINASSAWKSLQKVNEILEGGGERIPFRALLPKEGGDPELQVLDTAIRNVVDILARTRTGAAMNLKEEELYNQFAPTPWDTEENRKYKIQQLEGLFRMVMENEGVDVNALEGGSINGSIVDQYQY